MIGRTIQVYLNVSTGVRNGGGGGQWGHLPPQLACRGGNAPTKNLGCKPALYSVNFIVLVGCSN